MEQEEASFVHTLQRWNVRREVIESVKQEGIKSLFPVQESVIPQILHSFESESLASRDILVSSETGSGKTLAFVIPLISSLLSFADTRIRALVILPTRPLAVQVFEVFAKVAKGTGLILSLISGGRGDRKDVKYKNFMQFLQWTLHLNSVYFSAEGTRILFPPIPPFRIPSKPRRTLLRL